MALDDDQRVDSDLRDRIDTALLDSAQDAARKTARIAAGGYFLLLLFLLVGAVFYQRAANKRIESAELTACERVQVQRERANVSEARQYLLLSTIAESPRASRPVRVEYAGLASTTIYDPPTDCSEAVRQPDSYQRPPSIQFSVLPREFADAIVQAAKDKQPQPTP